MNKKHVLILFVFVFLFQFSTFGQKVGINLYKEYTLLPSRYGVEINYQFNDKIRLGYSYQHFNSEYEESEFDDGGSYTQDFYINPNIHIHEISFVTGRINGDDKHIVGIGFKPAIHINFGKKDIKTKVMPSPEWIYSTEKIAYARPSVSGLLFFGFKDIFNSNISLTGEIQGGIKFFGDYPHHQYALLQVLFAPFARIGINLTYKLPYTNHSNKTIE